VLDVNLTAGFRLARACLRGMMRQRWGRIIGITSIVGVTGNPGQANYAAAKAGMIGMSKALAAEVASRGITVNCVAPGFIATPMTDGLKDEQRSRLLAAIPAGRLGDPADIAAAVVYLASPATVAASAIAGHIVDPREFLERPLRREKEAGVPVGAVAGAEQEDYLWGV
jgi:3-oxoacyl-[acyl-carrier protein] reductase